MAFYRDHFIFQNSSETETELISRAIGTSETRGQLIYFQIYLESGD